MTKCKWRGSNLHWQKLQKEYIIKPHSSRQFHQMDIAQPPALCHDHRSFQVLLHSQNFEGHSVGGNPALAAAWGLSLVLSLMTLFSAPHLQYRDLVSITQQFPAPKHSDSVHMFCSRVSLSLFLQAGYIHPVLKQHSPELRQSYASLCLSFEVTVDLVGWGEENALQKLFCFRKKRKLIIKKREKAKLKISI